MGTHNKIFFVLFKCKTILQETFRLLIQLCMYARVQDHI